MNKKEPFLSIIIPAYRGEETVPRLLRSIFASSYQDFEVVIVDDGSPKPIRENLSNFSNLTNLRIIRLSKNGGPAGARNAGAKVALGRVLVFFDADVTLFADTLTRIAKRFNDPDTLALTGVWTKEQKSKAFFPNFKALRDWSYWINERDRRGYYYLFSTRNASIDKTLFFRLGGFNESYKAALVEDIELTYRIARRHAVIFDPKIRVRHEFEGFFPIAKKYFWRSYYWSGLYLKRRRFDPVATTLWETVTGFLGVLAPPTILLGVIFKPILFVGLLILAAHLLLLQKFIRFIFREKGLAFTLKGILTGIVLYYFIYAGVGWLFLSRGFRRFDRRGN